jgi:peptide/nickel transport system substrate-binding protein
MNRFAVILLMISIAVVSCERRRDIPPAKPVGGTVVVGLLSHPKTLNPLVAISTQSKDIINQMFLKLLDEQSDFLSFEPRLAESWDFSADSLAITFRLREDVLWQDSVRVTAADVRFTWELEMDTLVAWPSRHLKESIENVEVVDDHTVVFHFSTRYPYQLMDANDGVILPKHILEALPREDIRTSGFGRQPVGNGPFRLSRWVSGQYVELEKNPLYYEEGKPYLDRIIFRVVPDMTTLVTQLKSGEIDCLESIPTDAIPEFQSDYPDIKMYRYLSRNIEYIAWNLSQELLGGREVRRALGMAINTSEIIETLWNGMAEICDSPMHRVLWAYDADTEPLPFDPEKAKGILAKAGWRDGDGDGVLERGSKIFEIEMITNQGNQLRKDIATMVQEYFRRVGVKVNIRVLEWNTFIHKVINGDYESCVLGWKVATKADLTDFWRSTSEPPGGMNVSRYENAEVDALIDRAKNTLNVEDARRLWHRCQRIIYGDQPVVFLAIPYEVVGLKRRFCGVEPDATGFFVNSHEWYVSADCR